jgi:hypothetical protein
VLDLLPRETASGSMYRPSHVRAVKIAGVAESVWNEVIGRTGVPVSGGRAKSRGCLGLVPGYGASNGCTHFFPSRPFQVIIRS